jgi:hypothetical protein
MIGVNDVVAKTAVIRAPSPLASLIAAFAAFLDSGPPSVGTRMFLNMFSLSEYAAR